MEPSEKLERHKGVCQRCSKEGTVWWSTSLKTWLCEPCLYDVFGKGWRDLVEE